MGSTSMIVIDGSAGEGGGQILRTALGLSMATGRPFRVENVRARRPKPGLMRQHLTTVAAAASICGAAVEGAAIGSQVVTFAPGPVKPGEYTFSVGSAGSATLVLQAVLPALLSAAGPSSLTLEGGTHNPSAPPLDFVERAFLPLVNRTGPRVHVALERAGFYPAGGGRFFVNVAPARTLSPFHLTDRGETVRRCAKAVVAALPGAIALRELEQVEKLLRWSGDQLQVRQLPDEWGPGNLLTLEIESEHVTEVFSGFGMKGVTAEAVAEDAIRQARRYLSVRAPVGACLADQLMPILALAGGGSFRTLPLTWHARTNAAIIQQFLPVRFLLEAQADGAWLVEVEAT